MGKTIKQIADELGVSKQAVHQKRKNKELSAKLKPFTTTVDGVVYISVDGENLIKQAFYTVGRKVVVDNEPSTLDTLVYTLQNELEIKNKQIQELNDRLAETTAALVAAQQTAQTAQALHAGTLQQQLGSGGADPADPETQKEKKRWQFWK